MSKLQSFVNTSSSKRKAIPLTLRSGRVGTDDGLHVSFACDERALDVRSRRVVLLRKDRQTKTWCEKRERGNDERTRTDSATEKIISVLAIIRSRLARIAELHAKLSSTDKAVM